MTNFASVIIILYNGKKYISDCLDAIYTYKTNPIEVIVIDNASQDGSNELVKGHFPEVVIVQNQMNVGFAEACNQGAALANGEFLVFLNQDTRVQPGWLEALLAPLSPDGFVGLTTSKLLYMSNAEKINMCGNQVHYSGLSFGNGTFSPANQFQVQTRVSAVSGASFAVRKEFWQKLGGFDSQYFMYCEDTDLSWRAWMAGLSSLYTPDSIVIHDAPLNSSANALFYSTRNRWVLLLKTWKVLTLILLAPGLLLAEAVEWVTMFLYGEEAVRAKARGVGWLLQNMRSIFLRRKNAQEQRIKPDWFLLRQCVPVLKPIVMQGGIIGKVLISVANGLFWLNYWFAAIISRLLNN